MAHLGVLKVLEEVGINIDFISGSSIGAIVGAMYAQNPDAEAVIERIKDSIDDEFHDHLKLGYLKSNGIQNESFLHQVTKIIKRRIVINLARSREALLKNVNLRAILSKFIDEGKIEETKIPLSIVTTNLNTGEDIVFLNGDILDAVATSSSVPGFLPPVYLNQDLLVDGAVSCPVPVRHLSEMGADVTIGVDICIRDYHPLDIRHAIQIIARTEMITSRNLSRMMVNSADIAICPDTKDVQWSDFSRMDELIDAGIKNTREKLPEIIKAVRRKTVWYKRLF